MTDQPVGIVDAGHGRVTCAGGTHLRPCKDQAVKALWLVKCLCAELRQRPRHRTTSAVRRAYGTCTSNRTNGVVTIDVGLGLVCGLLAAVCNYTPPSPRRPSPE